MSNLEKSIRVHVAKARDPEQPTKKELGEMVSSFGKYYRPSICVEHQERKSKKKWGSLGRITKLNLDEAGENLYADIIPNPKLIEMNRQGVLLNKSIRYIPKLQYGDNAPIAYFDHLAFLSFTRPEIKGLDDEFPEWVSEFAEHGKGELKSLDVECMEDEIAKEFGGIASDEENKKQNASTADSSAVNDDKQEKLSPQMTAKEAKREVIQMSESNISFTKEQHDALLNAAVQTAEEKIKLQFSEQVASLQRQLETVNVKLKETTDQHLKTLESVKTELSDKNAQLVEMKLEHKVDELIREGKLRKDGKVEFCEAIKGTDPAVIEAFIKQMKPAVELGDPLKDEYSEANVKDSNQRTVKILEFSEFKANPEIVEQNLPWVDKNHNDDKRMELAYKMYLSKYDIVDKKGGK